MKKSVYLILLGALVLSFLTGCGTTADAGDSAVDTQDAVELMDETEKPITLEDILKANSAENIFENFEALTLREHDYAQDRDTEDYFSKNLNYRSGPEYYSLMSKDLVASNDPDGAAYGCKVDEDNFNDVFASYMKIDWTDYDGGEASIDGNILTVKCEYEDYVITFDEDSLLFLIKETKNKDGSDWLRTEYEYASKNRDADIIAAVKEDIEKNSEGETVNLVIKADGEERQFTVPMGYAAVIYSDDYYYYEGTEDAYFNQPLTEDTILTKIVEEDSEELAENTEE